jgi:hypothetical protein
MFVGHLGKARTETASRKKEKREKNTRTPTLVTYNINYNICYGRVKENFADWAGGCVQSIANVPLSARQSRSEKGRKRDGIEAGKE